MIKESKIRFLVFLGALALAAPTFAGCKKKDDSSSKSSDDKKAKDGKKGDDDDDDDKDSAEFARGDVLKHVPTTCDVARLYIDYAGLIADPALKANAGKIDDKIAEGIKGDQGEKAEEALKILKKAKIDPGTDIREFAVCANSKDDVVAVIGGDFAGKDVLGAIQKLSALDDDSTKELKKKDGDGFSYLKGKGKAIIAQLTPNVLAFADSVDAFADLVKANDQSSKFDAGKGRLFVLKGTSKKDGIDDGELQLNSKGDNIELALTATVSGKLKKELGSDPDASKSQIKQMIQMVASKLDDSPASELADDLRAAKVKIDGNSLSFTMKIPNKDLATALGKLVNMDESSLEQLANK